jgi:uncharacterized protein YdaU (DUF1376 family)
MPLYVGDYLADTSHLNRADHGSYLLLIMHYWKHGGLPDSDTELASIAKVPLEEWNHTVKHVVQAFFHDGWQHRRIDAELAKKDVVHTKRLIASQKGVQARMALGQINGIHGNHVINRLVRHKKNHTDITTTIVSKKDSLSTASSQSVAAPQQGAIDGTVVVETPADPLAAIRTKPPSQVSLAEYAQLLKARREREGRA